MLETTLGAEDFERRVALLVLKETTQGEALKITPLVALEINLRVAQMCWALDVDVLCLDHPEPTAVFSYLYEAG